MNKVLVAIGVGAVAVSLNVNKSYADSNATVNVSALNIRSGPGINYSKKGVVYKGASLNIIETNGEGEILWDKTINETFAIIQNNKPYYVELQTKNTIDNDYDYFRRLHECVLTQCSRELSDAGLLELFELTEVELTQEEISDFGDASYILYRLQSEIQTQYVTRKQNLLKTIYTYIANEKTDKNDVSYSLYGTNSFNLV